MPEPSLSDILNSKHPLHEHRFETLFEADQVLHQRIRGDHAQRYLPKGQDETTRDYDRRVQFARFKGELAPLVARLVGAVTARPPSRRSGDDDDDSAFQAAYEGLLENSDGAGHSLDQFMARRLYDSLGLGAGPFLVDRPVVVTDPETGDQGVMEVTSEGFELVKTFRPLRDDEVRLVPLKPYQITDWDVDVSGELNWVRIVEHTRRSRMPGMAQKIICYREYDRTAWRLFEKPDGNSDVPPVLIAHAEHGLGKVPLVLTPYELDGPMDFCTPFIAAVQYEVDHFRADADLQYSSWMHAHPTLKMKKADGEDARYSLGPHSVINLDPNMNEDADFLTLDSAMLEQLRKNKSEARDGMRRLAGVDLVSGGETGSQTMSGRSRAISFSVSEQRILVNLSKVAERAEEDLFELVDRFRNTGVNPAPSERVTDVSVSYPRSFMTEVEELIERWLSTRHEINSETYDREFQKKIAAMCLGNIPAEIQDRINHEIETNPLVGGASSPMLEDPMDQDPERIASIQELQPLRLNDVRREQA